MGDDGGVRAAARGDVDVGRRWSWDFGDGVEGTSSSGSEEEGGDDATVVVRCGSGISGGWGDMGEWDWMKAGQGAFRGRAVQGGVTLPTVPWAPEGSARGGVASVAGADALASGGGYTPWDSDGSEPEEGARDEDVHAPALHASPRRTRSEPGGAQTTLPAPGGADTGVGIGVGIGGEAAAQDGEGVGRREIVRSPLGFVMRSTTPGAGSSSRWGRRPESLSRQVIAGRYLRGPRLGRGGAGQVYKGIDLRGGDFVAIKRIRARVEGSEDGAGGRQPSTFPSSSGLPPELPRNVARELELLQGLRHPNVVGFKCAALGADPKRPGYMLVDIVLEFLESGSLADASRPSGGFVPQGLPEPLAALYIRQVLEGIVYLHARGVVHRDLKASNLMLTKDGTVKLIDFGVAKRFAESASTIALPRPRDDACGRERGGQGDVGEKEGEERCGEAPEASLGASHAHAVSSVVGTPYWMAPEVISLCGWTPKADVWSLGITTCEIVAGRTPYDGLEALSALFEIVDNPSGPTLPPNISPALRDFLSLCFIRDPALRPSAAHLLQHPWVAGAARRRAAEKQALREREGSTSSNAGIAQTSPPPRSFPGESSAIAHSDALWWGSGDLAAPDRAPWSEPGPPRPGVGQVTWQGAYGPMGTSPRPRVRTEPPAAGRGGSAPPARLWDPDDPDADPDSPVAPGTVEGYLFKRTSGILARWHLRFFRLDSRDDVLRSFSDDGRLYGLFRRAAWKIMSRRPPPLPSSSSETSKTAGASQGSCTHCTPPPPPPLPLSPPFPPTPAPTITATSTLRPILATMSPPPSSSPQPISRPATTAPASSEDEDGKPVARRGPGSAWTLSDGVFYVRRTDSSRSPLKLRARTAKEARRWVNALNKPCIAPGGEAHDGIRRRLGNAFMGLDDD